MKNFKEYLNNMLCENREWLLNQPINYLQRYLKIHKPSQDLKIAIEDAIRKKKENWRTKNVNTNTNNNSSFDYRYLRGLSTEELIDTIKEKNDENDHNGAVLILARYLRHVESMNIMKNIMEKHKELGHMTNELKEKRDKQYDILLQIAKSKLKENVVNKIKDAF